MNFSRTLIAVVFAILINLASGVVVLTPAALAEEKPFTQEQEDAIGELVRAYLLENPEVLPEAINVLRSRQEEDTKIAMRDAVKANYQRLINDGVSPVLGNPNGDVTIVEFYDYQCPFCRRGHADVMRLIDDDPNLRVVYKQFPIKDEPGKEPGSMIAARMAIASHSQGKFREFHNAAMKAPMPLSEAALLDAAQKIGINTRLLQTEIGNDTITSSIRDNMLLAREIGVNATPTYVIGSDVVLGAHGYDTLKAAVAAERAAKK